MRWIRALKGMLTSCILSSLDKRAAGRWGADAMQDVDYVLDGEHASGSSGVPGAVSGLQGRRYRVSLVAIRTLWFDRQLQDALSRDRHPSPLTVDLAVSPPGGAGGADRPVQVTTRGLNAAT